MFFKMFKNIALFNKVFMYVYSLQHFVFLTISCYGESPEFMGFVRMPLVSTSYHTKLWKGLNKITPYMTMHLSVCTHMRTHRHSNTSSELTMNSLHPKGVGDFFRGLSNRGSGWQWLLCPTMCMFFCVCVWIHSKRGSPTMCETWSSSIPRVTSTWWFASRNCREGGANNQVDCNAFIFLSLIRLGTVQNFLYLMRVIFHSFFVQIYLLTLKQTGDFPLLLFPSLAAHLSQVQTANFVALSCVW